MLHGVPPTMGNTSLQICHKYKMFQRISFKKQLMPFSQLLWFNQYYYAWRWKRVRCLRKCEISNESQCESNLFRVSKDQNNLASQSNPASRWLFNFQNRHFYPPVEMLNFEFGSCSMIKWSKPLQRTSTRLKGKQLNPFPDFECKTKNYFLQNFASSSYILHLEEETKTITF